ncbi:unnamed protein product, partial [Laminaria digitata]
MLAAQAGKTLDGVVLGTASNGLTQVRLGGETLLVRLTPPLPAGQPVQVTIQASGQGVPVLTVQPQVASAQVPLPVMPAPQAPNVPFQPQATVAATKGPVPTGHPSAQAQLPQPAATPGPASGASGPAARSANTPAPAAAPLGSQPAATPTTGTPSTPATATAPPPTGSPPPAATLRTATA